jgi:hypothetical protein
MNNIINFKEKVVELQKKDAKFNRLCRFLEQLNNAFEEEMSILYLCKNKDEQKNINQNLEELTNVMKSLKEEITRDYPQFIRKEYLKKVN